MSSGASREIVYQVDAGPCAGALAGALRDAESRGLDVYEGLLSLIAARPLTGTDDRAALLYKRVER